jgi:hypothetical protein
LNSGLSRSREAILKDECGGAWRSCVLRSHWRMIFPISRAHQIRTAEKLFAAMNEGVAPAVHLVRFPHLILAFSSAMMTSFDSALIVVRHGFYLPGKTIAGSKSFKEFPAGGFFHRATHSASDARFSRWFMDLP